MTKRRLNITSDLETTVRKDQGPSSPSRKKQRTEVEGQEATKTKEKLDTAYELGQIYLSLKKYEESIELFTEATKLAPNNAKYLHGLGEAYIDSRQYEKAIDTFTQVVKLDSTNPESFHSLGITYFNSGRYEEAIAPFTRATKLDSTNARYAHNLGDAYFHLGRYEEAIAPFTRATKLAPTNAPYLDHLGGAYYHLDQYEEAVAPFTRATKLAPNNSVDFHNLGMVYFCLGRYKEAIAPFTRATKLDPTNPEEFHFLAKTYLHLGRHIEAKNAILAFLSNVNFRKDFTEYAPLINQDEYNLEQYSILERYKIVDKYFVPLNEIFIAYGLAVDEAKMNLANAFVAYEEFRPLNTRKSLMESALRLYQEVGTNEALEKVFLLAKHDCFRDKEKFDIFSQLANQYILKNNFTKAFEVFQRATKCLLSESSGAMSDQVIEAETDTHFVRTSELFEKKEESQFSVDVLQQVMSVMQGDYEAELSMSGMDASELALLHESAF